MTPPAERGGGGGDGEERSGPRRAWRGGARARAAPAPAPAPRRRSFRACEHTRCL